MACMQYEPTIEELRHKYEVAMKEKMLVRLEKERLQARTEALEAQVLPQPCSFLTHPFPAPTPTSHPSTYTSTPQLGMPQQALLSTRLLPLSASTFPHCYKTLVLMSMAVGAATMSPRLAPSLDAL